jgi:hypothetical protein
VKRTASCFKKTFTTLKTYINLFRGHIEYFEPSWCSKVHRDLSGIVMVQCDVFTGNTVCFKKSFTTLKTYINLFRGRSWCSKIHRDLSGIVMVQCDVFTGNTVCFKKSFTTLKAYIDLFRGHV